MRNENEGGEGGAARLFFCLRAPLQGRGSEETNVGIHVAPVALGQSTHDIDRTGTEEK